MKIKLLYILTIGILVTSCEQYTEEEPIVNSQEAQISFTTLLCDTADDPGCTGELQPAMGATIVLYLTEEDRTNKTNEVTTIYTDHKGTRTTTVDPAFYYIYTLHMGRKSYSEENAVNRTTSFHEVIILE